MKQPNRSYIYLMLTILLWSATPAISKLALIELDNLQLVFYTSIAGVISLFFFVLFQNKIKHFKNFKRNDYLKIFGMGFLGIFLFYILRFGSFLIAPAGQTNIINFLWPVFVIIFSIKILKEKFNIKTIIAILISFFGALIIFTEGNLLSFNSEYTLGYLLALLGAICYGLFSVLGKKLNYEINTSMFLYYFFATLLIIPTTLIFSNFIIPRSITTIISIILLGGIINSIGFVFWFKALKKRHTHKTANTIYAVPFLALIWTYFLNSEPIRLFSLIGLILIITGIIIQIKNKS